MRGDMDVNAGYIIEDGMSIDQVGREIFDLSIRVAGGDQTCAGINKTSRLQLL